ncbi:hypothetical protein V2J09_016187 [Rumex salicifolius]
MGHRCCSKQKVKRGLWSPEEDEKLATFITSNGHSSWSSVPKLAGLERCGKSCRLRWINYLRPDLRRGSFTDEEEMTIIEVHRILGNRWAQIAKHLPGRTDNEVKNFWNSCIKKKLLAQGLDPNTHNLLPPPKPKNINNNNKNNVHTTSPSPKINKKQLLKVSSPPVFTVNTIRSHKKDSHVPHEIEPSMSLKAQFQWGPDASYKEQRSVGVINDNKGLGLMDEGSIPMWVDSGLERSHVEQQQPPLQLQEMINVGDVEESEMQMDGQSFEHLAPFGNNGGSAFDFGFGEFYNIIQSDMYGDVLTPMDQVAWDIAN